MNTQVFIIFSFFFFLSCSQLPHNKTPFHCHEERAALDMGSGSTKVIIAKVDRCKKEILSVIKEKNFPFKYKESLHLHKNTIPETMLNSVSEELNLFLSPFRKSGTQISAVATEVFRQASNGGAFVQSLSKRVNFPITIIDQKKEATLGFWGAVGLTQKPKDDIVVWDIGGGSMQITTLIGNTPHTYLGKLASVSFKNRIIHYQGRQRGSPNPIGHHTAKWAENLAKKIASVDVPEEIRDAISHKEVIGIGGVHYFSIREQLQKPINSPYSSFDLKKTINQRANWKDHKFQGNYKETEISNLILVKAFYDALNMKGVLPQKVNLATGVLLDDDLW